MMFKPFLIIKITLMICLGSNIIQEILGATQLTENTNDVTINSEDSIGMPTDVTITYESDLASQAVTSSTTDKVWIEWSMSGGSGASYYSGTPPGTITVDSSTEFSIALTRTVDDPSNGDYTVLLDVILWYNNNDGNEFVLDNNIYTFNIHIGGSSTTIDITAGSATNGSLSVDSVTENTEGDGTILSDTPTLSTRTIGTTGFGDPIELEISVSGGGTDHTIWIDPTTDPIIVSDDAIFTDPEDYEWPLVGITSSTTSETGTTTSVDITLDSVPIRVFNWEDVYIRLTVHFRNNSNDLRHSLRRRRQLNDNQRQSSEEEEEGTVYLVGKIQFVSNDASDGCNFSIITKRSFLTVSSTAAIAAGAVLFL